MLGANVWLSMIVLPAAYVVGTAPWQLGICSIPLAVLLLGVWRRSEAVLLGGFPAATAAVLVAIPELATAQVYGAVRFGVVAAGITAYMFAIAYFTTFHEPPPPTSVRPLASAAVGQEPRWRRRERMYWLLAVGACAFPLTLLIWTLFDAHISLYLQQMYPGRVALMTTGITISVLVFWAGVYQWVWLGILRPHRAGDRDLLTRLALLRNHSATRRPRLGFYVAVAFAIGAIVLLLLRQA